MTSPPRPLNLVLFWVLFNKKEKNELKEVRELRFVCDSVTAHLFPFLHFFDLFDVEVFP